MKYNVGVFTICSSGTFCGLLITKVLHNIAVFVELSQRKISQCPRQGKSIMVCDPYWLCVYVSVWLSTR